MRWRAVPAAEYSLLALDDQCAIYHRPSGQTHFLNAAAQYLLTAVLRSTADFQTVLAALNNLPGLKESPMQPRQVVGLLRRLDELGLIERLGPTDDG